MCVNAEEVAELQRHVFLLWNCRQISLPQNKVRTLKENLRISYQSKNGKWQPWRGLNGRRSWVVTYYRMFTKHWKTERAPPKTNNTVTFRWNKCNWSLNYSIYIYIYVCCLESFVFKYLYIYTYLYVFASTWMFFFCGKHRLFCEVACLRSFGDSTDGSDWHLQWRTNQHQYLRFASKSQFEHHKSYQCLVMKSRLISSHDLLGWVVEWWVWRSGDFFVI